MSRPVYLDCNATTPLEPEVAEILRCYLDREFGNEASRTHVYGAEAKKATQLARDQIASVVHARKDEVIFTSGATEANNIALLGLMAFGEETGKKHVIVSSIEHKAVLEPVEAMAHRGFEVTYLDCGPDGLVKAEQLATALREDTLFVSVMAANNETGVKQALAEISAYLKDSPAFLHVDAAQAFGKDLELLRNQRIDLISVSGHKLFAPKGVGALISRRRGYQRVPLAPLMYGGGQERGLRPGTLPVALVAAFGKTAELAVRQNAERRSLCLGFKKRLEEAFAGLEPIYYGCQERTMDHVACLAIPGIDSEALMVALKEEIAISNGSACTSSNYRPSHVLQAMGLSEQKMSEVIRISWCHLTRDPNWSRIVKIISGLRS